MRSISAGEGGKRRGGGSSAQSTSASVRTNGGQTLKWPCTRTGGRRRAVRAASAKREATAWLVHSVMAASVESFAEAADHCPICEVKARITDGDHENVLIAPAVALHGFGISCASNWVSS